MARRYRRKKRLFSKKRKYGRRIRRFRLKKRIRGFRRMLNKVAETKFDSGGFFAVSNNVALKAATATNQFPDIMRQMLNNIAQGSGVADRIGDKIFIKNIRYKVLLSCGEQNPVQLRETILKCKDPANAMDLAVAGAGDIAAKLSYFFDYIIDQTKLNAEGLRIVKDRMLHSNGKNQYGYTCYKQVTKNFKINATATYQNGVCTRLHNFPFVMYTSSSTNLPFGFITGSYKINFTDV